MANGKGFGKQKLPKRERKITPRVGFDFEKFVAKHLGEDWSDDCAFDTFDDGYHKYIRLTVPKERHAVFTLDRCEQIHKIANEFGLSGFKIVLSPLTRAALWELKLAMKRGGHN